MYLHISEGQRTGKLARKLRNLLVSASQTLRSQMHMPPHLAFVTRLLDI